METTTTPAQGQAQPEVSGLDRLEQFLSDGQPAAPSATQETETLESPPETPEPTEQKPAEPEAIKPEAQKPEEQKEEPFEFKIEDEPAQDESWKSFLIEKGFQVPEDFTEEKGAEVYEKLTEEKYSKQVEEAKTYSIAAEIAQFPDTTQSEARLVIDLLKTGQSLEQYFEPIRTIKDLRALSPEQLVRKNLEGLDGWTPEMVDSEMQKITERNGLDIEHKKLLWHLDKAEAALNDQHKQQIEHYNTQQSQINEQKQQRELSDMKTLLDRMPAYMDVKLKDEHRKHILDFASKLEMPGVPLQEKIEYALFRKFGKQFVAHAQARALEKVQVENSKKQHNVPHEVAPTGGNRAAQNNQFKDGLEALDAYLNT